MDRLPTNHAIMMLRNVILNFDIKEFHIQHHFTRNIIIKIIMIITIENGVNRYSRISIVDE